MKILFILLLISNFVLAQKTSEEILFRSIKVHDPHEKWHKIKADFEINIEREKTPPRFFTVKIDFPKKSFFYAVQNDTSNYMQGFRNQKHELIFNGDKNISEENIKKYELTEKRSQYLKEVYEYLLFLPMRLKNDIKFLDKKYSEEIFNLRPSYKLTISYPPLGENETWYFFIDKENFTLNGYQFYLKNIKTDGEYIYLEDYITYKNILIPKTKKWFWNKDDSYFRTDKIIDIK